MSKHPSCAYPDPFLMGLDEDAPDEFMDEVLDLMNNPGDLVQDRPTRPETVTEALPPLSKLIGTARRRLKRTWVPKDEIRKELPDHVTDEDFEQYWQERKQGNRYHRAYEFGQSGEQEIVAVGRRRGQGAPRDTPPKDSRGVDDMLREFSDDDDLNVNEAAFHHPSMQSFLAGFEREVDEDAFIHPDDLIPNSTSSRAALMRDGGMTFEDIEPLTEDEGNLDYTSYLVKISFSTIISEQMSAVLRRVRKRHPHVIMATNTGRAGKMLDDVAIIWAHGSLTDKNDILGALREQGASVKKISKMDQAAGQKFWNRKENRALLVKMKKLDQSGADATKRDEPSDKLRLFKYRGSYVQYKNAEDYEPLTKAFEHLKQKFSLLFYHGVPRQKAFRVILPPEIKSGRSLGQHLKELGGNFYGQPGTNTPKQVLAFWKNNRQWPEISQAVLSGALREDIDEALGSYDSYFEDDPVVASSVPFDDRKSSLDNPDYDEDQPPVQGMPPIPTRKADAKDDPFTTDTRRGGITLKPIFAKASVLVSKFGLKPDDNIYVYEHKNQPTQIGTFEMGLLHDGLLSWFSYVPWKSGWDYGSNANLPLDIEKAEDDSRVVQAKVREIEGLVKKADKKGAQRTKEIHDRLRRDGYNLRESRLSEAGDPFAKELKQALSEDVFADADRLIDKIYGSPKAFNAFQDEVIKLAGDGFESAKKAINHIKKNNELQERFAKIVSKYTKKFSFLRESYLDEEMISGDGEGFYYQENHPSDTEFWAVPISALKNGGVKIIMFRVEQGGRMGGKAITSTINKMDLKNWTRKNESDVPPKVIQKIRAKLGSLREDRINEFRDEQAENDKFVDMVGGTAKADRMMQIMNNSYPVGTQYDKLMKNGQHKTKEQVFAIKAKRAGFTNKQIQAFLSLSEDRINEGRHYTADEWPAFFASMEGESSGYPNWKDPDQDGVTSKLKQTARTFTQDVDKASEVYFEKSPEELADGASETDFMGAEWVSDVLLTLEGHGAGIWDGDWDHLFQDGNKGVRKMEVFLKGRLSNIHDKIMDAIRDSAYETMGGKELNDNQEAAEKWVKNDLKRAVPPGTQVRSTPDGESCWVTLKFKNKTEAETFTADLDDLLQDTPDAVKNWSIKPLRGSELNISMKLIDEDRLSEAQSLKGLGLMKAWLTFDVRDYETKEKVKKKLIAAGFKSSKDFSVWGGARDNSYTIRFIGKTRHSELQKLADELKDSNIATHMRTTPLSESRVSEAFREGTATHFEALAKRLLEPEGVKVEFTTKDKRKPSSNGDSWTTAIRITVPDKDSYEWWTGGKGLPRDKMYKFQGLLQQFKVDYPKDWPNGSSFIVEERLDEVEWKGNMTWGKPGSKITDAERIQAIFLDHNAGLTKSEAKSQLQRFKSQNNLDIVDQSVEGYREARHGRLREDVDEGPGAGVNFAFMRPTKFRGDKPDFDGDLKVNVKTFKITGKVKVEGLTMESYYDAQKAKDAGTLSNFDFKNERETKKELASIADRFGEIAALNFIIYEVENHMYSAGYTRSHLTKQGFGVDGTGQLEITYADGGSDGIDGVMFDAAFDPSNECIRAYENLDAIEEGALPRDVFEDAEKKTLLSHSAREAKIKKLTSPGGGSDSEYFKFLGTIQRKAKEQRKEVPLVVVDHGFFRFDIHGGLARDFVETLKELGWKNSGSKWTHSKSKLKIMADPGGFVSSNALGLNEERENLIEDVLDAMCLTYLGTPMNEVSGKPLAKKRDWLGWGEAHRNLRDLKDKLEKEAEEHALRQAVHRFDMPDGIWDSGTMIARKMDPLLDRITKAVRNGSWDKEKRSILEILGDLLKRVKKFAERPELAKVDESALSERRRRLEEAIGGEETARARDLKKRMTGKRKSILDYLDE